MRYLVRMIDDATSRSGGRFVQHDGTRENMGVLWQYVERTGGWWMSTRTGPGCSWWRRGPRKARSSGRRRID